jgi:O-antigen/teichoic acid export membrane protein
MSIRMIFLEVIGVVCGAVIGALVFLLLAWLFASDYLALVGGFGGIAVAAVVSVIYAVFYHYMSQTPAALASFFAGFLLPVLAGAVLIGSLATTLGPLVAVFGFAVSALLVYRFVFTRIAGIAAGRDTAPRAVPDDRPHHLG